MTLFIDNFVASKIFIWSISSTVAIPKKYSKIFFFFNFLKKLNNSFLCLLVNFLESVIGIVVSKIL